jgi:hypothetical protein
LILGVVSAVVAHGGGQHYEIDGQIHLG